LRPNFLDIKPSGHRKPLLCHAALDVTNPKNVRGRIVNTRIDSVNIRVDSPQANCPNRHAWSGAALKKRSLKLDTVSGIVIKRAGIGGPKITALQSLSRSYPGVSWFRSSVGEQTWSTMRYSSPDRLNGTRVPRS
jgi:hypothetical protein